MGRILNFQEEDFFAFSPSANLVGVIEEGHERFSALLEAVKTKRCLDSLFVYSEKGFRFFDKLTEVLKSYESKIFLADSRIYEISHGF